jgi:mono/diheme cytochrome c family protein
MRNSKQIRLEAMMKIPNGVRSLAIAVTVLVSALAFLIISVPARTVEDDAAAVYKTKCAMCHGAAAEKKFDAAKPDADLTQIVLKGKKAQKPPNMPAYEEKGITEDQAKTLIAYMKSLKQ